MKIRAETCLEREGGGGLRPVSLPWIKLFCLFTLVVLVSLDYEWFLAFLFSFCYNNKYLTPFCVQRPWRNVSSSRLKLRLEEDFEKSRKSVESRRSSMKNPRKIMKTSLIDLELICGKSWGKSREGVWSLLLFNSFLNWIVDKVKLSFKLCTRLLRGLKDEHSESTSSSMCCHLPQIFK